MLPVLTIIIIMLSCINLTQNGTFLLIQYLFNYWNYVQIAEHAHVQMARFMTRKLVAASEVQYTQFNFKGISWDRRRSPPSIRIFSHTCWFLFTEMHLSDPSSNCFTIDVWKIKCWIQHFISYFLISSSVVFWHVIFWE